MLARLGDVLYWFGCIVAIIIAVIVGRAWLDGKLIDAVDISILAVIVAAIWLVGRACRYVLSGKWRMRSILAFFIAAALAVSPAYSAALSWYSENGRMIATLDGDILIGDAEAQL